MHNGYYYIYLYLTSNFYPFTMQTFKTPVDAFLYWEGIQPEKVFFNQPIKGKNKTYTYQEAGA